jgi:hypothetical protein
MMNNANHNNTEERYFRFSEIVKILMECEKKGLFNNVDYPNILKTISKHSIEAVEFCGEDDE